MSKYEPCSICEEYIEGVICDKDKCPVAKMKKEIERLQKLNESFSCLGMLYSEVKSETRKEFAERVKKKAASRTYAQIWDSVLDEVLAEMEERQ